MSFGKRRAKPQRGRLRPLPWAPIENLQSRRRERGLRLLLFAATVILAAILVYGSGSPLDARHRVGMRADRDIRVKVDKLQRIDAIRTNNDRVAAEKNTPPILNNDRSKIDRIRDSILELIDAVVSADSYERVPESLRLSWKLDEATFTAIKETANNEFRVRDLQAAIREAFEPLAKQGVLAIENLPAKLRDEESFRVRTRGSKPSEVLSPVSYINYRLVADPNSDTGKEFISRIDDRFKNQVGIGKILFQFAGSKLADAPTLILDEEATKRAKENARNAVGPTYEEYRKGDLIIAGGDEITEEGLALLVLEHKELLEEMSWAVHAERAASIGLAVLATCGLIVLNLKRNYPQVIEDWGKLFGLSGLTLAAMLGVRMLSWGPSDAEMIAVAIASMIVAIAFGPSLAVTFVLGLCILTSIAMGFGLDLFLILLGGSAAGALMLNEIRERTRLIFVGLLVGAAFAVLTWIVGLWQGYPLALIGSDSLYRALWGVLAGFVLGGILPFIEDSCGIVTGISLLELGDQSHPLLQELIRRAPGTHNHSMAVATIAEAAAKRIGADSLLVRVGAYFHDIGKMMKPHYFVENQLGTANRHANLAPAMSTLIIINHVKEGAELAKQHSLPEPIIDFIEQHHGTTLVEYFYREASKRSEGDPNGSPLSESAFRYPGPKPQSQETAILMIADACESASRSLSEPTPGRIEGLVSELIDKRLRDGQFDECNLTLRQITEIRESVIKSLNAIYHGRVKYPEQRTA